MMLTQMCPRIGMTKSGKKSFGMTSPVFRNSLPIRWLMKFPVKFWRLMVDNKFVLMDFGLNPPNSVINSKEYRTCTPEVLNNEE